MKRLLFILIFVTGTAQADSGAEAFVTGFANALNRSMGGNPNDSRPQPVVQQVEVTQTPLRTYNVVMAVRTDGGYGVEFANYADCEVFVRNTFGFRTCTVVAKSY